MRVRVPFAQIWATNAYSVAEIFGCTSWVHGVLIFDDGFSSTNESILESERMIDLDIDDLDI